MLVWGWVLTGVFTMLVGLAMSELSSKFPVSGGLYFWSYMLTGQHGPCASWFVCHVAGAGEILIFCCVLSHSQPLELINSGAGCLRQWQYIHVRAILCCWIISLQ